MNYAKIIGNVISLPKNRMCRLSLHSLFALVLLAIGAFIYLMFRSPNLVIFKWCESLGFLDYVMKYRDQFVDTDIGIFSKYCLPDGLWIASYVILIHAIIPKEDKNMLLFWSFILPFIAILFELLQIPGLIPGTFDFLDLISYIVPLLIYIIYLKYEKAI
jgi:hypothetical protein